MVIRRTLKTISEPEKTLEVYAVQFADLTQELAEKAFRQIESPLLDELRFYPPERPGQRYVRTFRLRRGWKASLERINNDTTALVVSNDVEYASFVVGSLAQRVSAGARFQADIHKGRWPLATETVSFWQIAYFEILQDEFERELSQFGTITNRARAFTRIPR
jgi:hypothetical protein